jgi:hypothetical protein
MAVRREDVIESTRPVALATPQIGAADATGSIWVPLNRLKDSPKNMRQVPHTEAHIKTLAALIHATRQKSESRASRPVPISSPQARAVVSRSLNESSSTRYRPISRSGAC